MEFTYLDDPGVKIRYRRKETDEKFLPENIPLEDDDVGDSILQKYDFIFERIWYTGHIFVMTTSLLSILFCLTLQVRKPWPRFIYRSTFVGAALTYSMSLLQNLNGAQPGFFALLPLATFQYIIMSLIWIFTIPHTIKLIPFALFSLLHVSDTAKEHHAKSKSRSRIAQGLSDELAPKVIDALGYLDIWLLVELLRDCILIRPGAVISLIVFSFFYRINLMYSPASYAAFENCYRRIDHFMIRDETPKRARELWIRLRNKFVLEELRTSKLHAEETDKAIELVNLFSSLA